MWNEEEIEFMSKDTAYIEKVSRRSLDDLREQQISEADIISQDPELVEHYGMEDNNG